MGKVSLKLLLVAQGQEEDNMATVIQLAKDTRASDLGKGVASFLERRRDKRIDGLQQELMQGIGSAADEAEATALMGDPKYQEVVTDNSRFSAIVTHFNNAPLGTTPIIGYDEFGEQQMLSVREGTDVAEAMRKAGLTSERKRMMYSTQLGDPLSAITPEGRFGSTREAEDNASTEDILGKRIFVDQDTAMKMQTLRSSNASLVDQRAARRLSEEKFQFTKEGGHSPFANLQADIRDGKFPTEEDEQAAWKRMIHIWGRTATDVKLKYQQELLPEGAAIHALSETMVLAMEMVEADQNIISGVAVLPKAWNTIQSEVEALAGGLGLTVRPLKDYDPWFEANGLGERSTAFKNMITTMALGLAASHGQSGRSLSDKDFDRFLTIAGVGIRDGATFITSLNQAMLGSQRQFSTRYSIMTSDLAAGVIGNWEAEHGAFPQFGSGMTKEEEAKNFVTIWNDDPAHANYQLALPTGSTE